MISLEVIIVHKGVTNKHNRNSSGYVALVGGLVVRRVAMSRVLSGG